MKKKICIITGSRAEYGLLKPVISRIQDDTELELQILVTGSHLSKRHGETYREIENDGFNINARIDLCLEDDSTISIANSMGLAVNGFARYFETNRPDIIVLLGDRYEIFMAATAATIQRIPIAHINGGDTTEGAFDEAFRHCISKMSHLHFTTTQEYRSRVIQLGEHPDSVFHVGALGVEVIKNSELLSRDNLESDINFKVDKNTILVTFHPVTLEYLSVESQFSELLKALDCLNDITVIFTKSNADTDGEKINEMIEEYVGRNMNKAICFSSMGQLRYLSALKYAGAIVGNSSSGIIEAPSMGIYTVNIGDRQKGRIQGKTVINCSPSMYEISQAILQAISKKESMHLYKCSNPYEGNNTSQVIVETIKQKVIYNKISLKKEFFDIKT